MKLGVIRVPSGIEAADPGVAAELGRIVEASGCESLWTVEHVVVPDRYDSVYPFHPSGKMRLDAADEIPDPMTWMTWLSARTTTLRLGVGVLILPLRNPVVLAKQLATMDRLSGGRIILGAGLGWMSEEYDAIGVPFERRGHRADEYLGAMRALWSTSPASFHGDTVDFTDIHCHPQPRSGRVPIVIGGISRAAVRRAVRFGDGMHLLRTPLEEVHEVTEMLAEECARVDRDPGEIELTMIAPRSGDELSAMAELGVGRVILSLWEGDLGSVSDEIRAYQTDVMGAIGA